MRIHWRSPGTWVGPGLALLVAFLPSPLHEVPGVGSSPAYAAAVAVLMASWWFSEALPIAWTACVPLVAWPLLGMFHGTALEVARKTTSPYLNAYIFLFLGGMVLGAAIEESGLHRRIALRVMVAIGTDPARLLLGTLVATALVSMWLSNTATAVMMLPIGLALVARVEEEHGRGRLQRFGGAVMLAIAWGANVGGVGTKIGTGVNSILVGFFSETMGYELSFLRYMLLGTPFVLLAIPIVWAVLWSEARHDEVRLTRGDQPLREALSALGPLSSSERRVATVFAVAATLWVFGDLLRPLLVPAVTRVTPFQQRHYEALVALLAGGTLLAMRSVHLVTLRKVPWGTLLLLGGSFALAEGIEASGLATFVSGELAAVASWSLSGQLLATTTVTVILTAFASNTATVNVMLHVLPRSLPLLAASGIASSCDFALPAGTPPNAIVFGSGYVRARTMMRLGLLLDVTAIVGVALYMLVWGTRLL